MAEALEILWSPIRFMRARCREDIKLAAPFVIFVGALMISVIDMAIMYGRVMDRMPARVQEGLSMANLGFGISLFAFAINMFLFWVLGSGILACLAILLDGEGEYRRVLQLSGLAHLPVLVVGAGGDRLVRIQLVEELARGIPGARLHCFEDAGHGVISERADEVADLLRSSVSDADRAWVPEAPAEGESVSSQQSAQDTTSGASF